jgi:hypothetical protein
MSRKWFTLTNRGVLISSQADAVQEPSIIFSPDGNTLVRDLGLDSEVLQKVVEAVANRMELPEDSSLVLLPRALFARLVTEAALRTSAQHYETDGVPQFMPTAIASAF